MAEIKQIVYLESFFDLLEIRVGRVISVSIEESPLVDAKIGSKLF